MQLGAFQQVSDDSYLARQCGSIFGDDLGPAAVMLQLFVCWLLPISCCTGKFVAAVLTALRAHQQFITSCYGLIGNMMMMMSSSHH
jgi:hypothetical protein